MPLTTAIKTPTPMTNKNLVALKPINTPTGQHKAKIVTPTYTDVLLQMRKTSCNLTARHGVQLSFRMQTSHFHVIRCRNLRKHLNARSSPA